MSEKKGNKTDAPTAEQPAEPEATSEAPAAEAESAVAGEGAQAATAVAEAPDPFEELSDTPALGEPGSLSLLYDLRMPVSVELGRSAMTIREVLALRRGSLLQLDRIAGESVDVFVGDRKLGKGEVVVLGQHFGIRLTELAAGGLNIPGEEVAS